MIKVAIVTTERYALHVIGTAIKQSGAEAVPFLGESELPPGPLPFYFLVYVGRPDDEVVARLAARLDPRAHMVVVVARAELGDFVAVLAHAPCNHITDDSPAGLQRLSTTVGKFVSGDVFGLEKYLPDDTKVELVRLYSFEGREAAIEQVLEAAQSQGVRTRMREQIAQVCSELLMNALYDAPVDEEGQLLFRDVSGIDRLDRVSPRPVSLRYARVGKHFVVSVRDRYGRLDKATILRYVDKCLHSSEQVDRKTYGAGLGLYLICRAANQLIVNVAPGMATEVITGFDTEQVRSGLKLFSVFVHPGSEAAQQSEVVEHTMTVDG